MEAARRTRHGSTPCIGSTCAQVYSYAVYELRDQHEAEDATERTFLAALGALPPVRGARPPEDGDGASTFRVWLFQIARNEVAERRRARRRRPETPLEAAADRRGPARPRGRRRAAATRPRRLARDRPAARRPTPGA